ncbi:MAG: hypothetical protein EP343_19005 [Deltaproteobacteria bacterium]|nr:MAG: hypothetical protein EP343_19005 [Deltaproteobacteria bacterium]
MLWLKKNDDHRRMGESSSLLDLRIAGLVWALIVFVPITCLASQKEGKTCQKLGLQKSYLQQAHCFLGLFRAVDKHPVWKQDAALYKDRYLRKAALGFLRASQFRRQQGPHNHLKSQAVRWLRHSFKQGFCEAANRCRSNELLASRIHKSIHKAPLAVVTNNRKARITVVGYKYRVSRMQRFNATLPTGKYTVTIRQPGKPPQTRSLLLQHNRSTLLNITEAKILIREKRIVVAKKIPPLVVSGYVVGSTMLVLGAALMTYGVLEQGRLNGVMSDPIKNKTMTDGEFNDGFFQAEALKVAGGVTGGTGISLVLGGVIAHVAANKAAKAKRPQPPLQARQITSHNLFLHLGPQ